MRPAGNCKASEEAVNRFEYQISNTDTATSYLVIVFVGGKELSILASVSSGFWDNLQIKKGRICPLRAGNATQIIEYRNALSQQIKYITTLEQ